MMSRPSILLQSNRLYLILVSIIILILIIIIINISLLGSLGNIALISYRIYKRPNNISLRIQRGEKLHALAIEFSSNGISNNIPDLMERKVIDDLNIVIDNNRNDYKSHYIRACARGNVGNYQGAIDDFTSCFKLNSKYFPCLMGRAAYYKKVGQSDKSIEDYSYLINNYSAKPINNIDIICIFYYNRASSYLIKDQYINTIDDINVIFDNYNSNCPIALNQLLVTKGIALYKMNEEEKGIQHIVISCKLGNIHACEIIHNKFK